MELCLAYIGDWTAQEVYLFLSEMADFTPTTGVDWIEFGGDNGRFWWGGLGGVGFVREEC